MPLTRSHILRLLRIGIAVIIVALIAAYSIWRSLNYARGPEIDISEPGDGSSIPSPTVVIRGAAKRINTLYLNGRPITIDEQGNFKETVLLFRGLNIISLQADDQFGRHTDTELRLIGTVDFPAPHTPSHQVTSTSTTSSQ